MLWLCQITFAGVGAIATGAVRDRARVAVHPARDRRAASIAARDRGGHRPPHDPARQPLHRAGHAHVRAAHGATRVQPASTFAQSGVGVADRPTGLRDRPTRRSSTSRSAVFAVFAILIVNLRRSTTGLALNAVRWSETASRTMGLSVIQMKMLVSGLAAFVAGVGGGLYAIAAASRRIPLDYATLLGLVWLAVLVTFGVRSNIAALLAAHRLRHLARAASRRYSTERHVGAAAGAPVRSRCDRCWRKNPEGTVHMRAMAVPAGSCARLGGARAVPAATAHRRPPRSAAAPTDDGRRHRRRTRRPDRDDRGGHGAMSADRSRPQPRDAGRRRRAGARGRRRHRALRRARRAERREHLACRPATSSASSGPTARARPRCSTWSPGCCGRRRARCSSAAGGSPARARRSARASGSPARSSSSSCSWASPCASTSCSGTGSATSAAGSGAISSPPARCTAEPTEEQRPGRPSRRPARAHERRRHPARRRSRSAPPAGSRWHARSPPARRSCCSTSRRRGSTRTRPRSSAPRSAPSSRRRRSRCCSSSTTSPWCSACRARWRCSTSACASRTAPPTRSATTPRCAPRTWATTKRSRARRPTTTHVEDAERMSDSLLSVEDLDVRYGSVQALFDVSHRRARGLGRRRARRQRRGQEHARPRGVRAGARRSAARVTFGGDDITKWPPAPDPPRRPRAHPRGSRHLPRPLGAGEPAHGGAPGRHPRRAQVGDRPRVRDVPARSPIDARSGRARCPAASSRCSRSHARWRCRHG